MAKRISKILTTPPPPAPTPPPIAPTPTPNTTVGSLKGQKSKGEELLRKNFLSLGDVQHWNLITKDILTKAVGSESDLIDSILYAGKDRVFSMFEPESILEKHRRKNFLVSLNTLKDFIDHLESGKEFPKKDTSKKIENTKAPESPKVSLIHDLDEEEKVYRLHEIMLRLICIEGEVLHDIQKQIDLLDKKNENNIQYRYPNDNYNIHIKRYKGWVEEYIQKLVIKEKINKKNIPILNKYNILLQIRI